MFCFFPYNILLQYFPIIPSLFQPRKRLADISKKHNIWGMKVSIKLSLLKLKTINEDIDFAADFLKRFPKCEKSSRDLLSSEKVYWKTIQIKKNVTFFKNMQINVLLSMFDLKGQYLIWTGKGHRLENRI